jgi:2-keto-4-pentenoate hydratase
VTLTDDAAAIAARFLAARRGAAGLGAFPGALPETLEAAYRIQDEAIAACGLPVVGWKIGRIAEPLASRFGFERLAGPIFAERRAAAEEIADMPAFAEGFVAGEAEFLLRIGTAPDPSKTRYTLEEAAALIDAVFVGIEIASSPLATINVIGPLAVISDFGNNNGLLVGAEVPDWRESGFEDWEVALDLDGVPTGRGTAWAFPGGAIGSARFLFEHMAQRGIALRPGQWISSGAVGGVHQAAVGQIVEARFGSLPPVRCRLVSAGALVPPQRPPRATSGP